MQSNPHKTDHQKIKDMLKSYCDAGIKIHPIKGPRHGIKSKEPLTPNGFKDATCDWKIVQVWIKQYNDCWWGAPCDQFVVIDVDNRNKEGSNGMEDLKELFKELGDLPQSRTHSTQGGGYHLFFKRSKNITCTNGMLKPNIDVKSVGGYVIIPPSSGYEVITEIPFDKLPELPKRWANKIREIARKKVVSIDGTTPVNKGLPHKGLVPKGQRDTWLTSQAGSMLKAGIDPEAAFEALKFMRDNRCELDPSDPITDQKLWGLAKRAGWYQDPGFYIPPDPKSLPGFKIYNHNQIVRRAAKAGQKKHIIQDLLTVGSTLIHAKQKCGKSRFVLQMLDAVCTGKPFLGHYQVVEKAEVLYMGLDRWTDAKIKRAFQQFSGGNPPAGFHAMYDNVDNEDNILMLEFGFEDYLEATIQMNPSIKIVAVDLMIDCWPPYERDSTQYAQDYRRTRFLSNFAERLDIALILVQHDKKTKTDDSIDASYGTAGLSGGVTCDINLQRKRNFQDAKIFITGNEIEENDRDLQFIQGVWSMNNDPVKEQREDVAPEVKEIWQLLNEHGALTVRQIAELRKGTNKESSARNLLGKMLKRGQVRCDRDRKPHLYWYGEKK